MCATLDRRSVATSTCGPAGAWGTACGSPITNAAARVEWCRWCHLAGHELKSGSRSCRRNFETQLRDVVRGSASGVVVVVGSFVLSASRNLLEVACAYDVASSRTRGPGRCCSASRLRVACSSAGRSVGHHAVRLRNCSCVGRGIETLLCRARGVAAGPTQLCCGHSARSECFWGVEGCLRGEGASPLINPVGESGVCVSSVLCLDRGALPRYTHASSKGSPASALAMCTDPGGIGSAAGAGKPYEDWHPRGGGLPESNFGRRHHSDAPMGGAFWSENRWIIWIGGRSSMIAATPGQHPTNTHRRELNPRVSLT